MPSMNNYLNFIYVNLGFVAQIVVMMYFKSALEIQKNWPLYRCNPPYWVFSKNITEDFNYCVQNTQTNMMGYLLEPVNSLIGSLTSVGTQFSGALNNVRTMFSSIRDFVTSIIQNVFGVFLNLIIEFQKMMISIKDMLGKMIGVVATLMFVLDGSIKTMKSTWNGPPGQMVRAIGSCFHPDTLVELKDGTQYAMKDLPLGSDLKDGSKVFAVLKIDNTKKEKLYKISHGVNENDIYVTGEHLIRVYEEGNFDRGLWKQVKDYKDAIIQDEVYSDWFSCIITTNGRIVLGKRTFWDWEDDEYYN
jgi:hypothetical protein